MLRIYPVLLDLVRTVGPLVKRLERHDADLAKQCRKALASAPLNVAEGMYPHVGRKGRLLLGRASVLIVMMDPEEAEGVANHVKAAGPSVD